MDQTQDRAELLDKLAAEEATESNLIWLYDSLLGMGVENCFPPDRGQQLRAGMKILADESREHRLTIDKIKEKYKI